MASGIWLIEGWEWLLNRGIFAGALAGSLIELVEILVVVLVVGRIAGWRNALAGAGAAIGPVALLAGSGLTLMPLRLLEVLGGTILLALGGWWARSATKHYGGLTHSKDDEDVQLDDGAVRVEG